MGDRGLREKMMGEGGQTIIEYMLVAVLFILLLFLALESANMTNVLESATNTLQDHLIVEE
jgi:Flp pilus assembly protein TadG